MLTEERKTASVTWQSEGEYHYCQWVVSVHTSTGGLFVTFHEVALQLGLEIDTDVLNIAYKDTSTDFYMYLKTSSAFLVERTVKCKSVSRARIYLTKSDKI